MTNNSIGRLERHHSYLRLNDKIFDQKIRHTNITGAET